MIGRGSGEGEGGKCGNSEAGKTEKSGKRSSDNGANGTKEESAGDGKANCMSSVHI